MPLPQYRIPVERLKEEWAERVRMEELGMKPPAKISHNSLPIISHLTSVQELWELACKINEAAAQSQSQKEMSDVGPLNPH